jgi:heterodisulfide reductase subunit B
MWQRKKRSADEKVDAILLEKIKSPDELKNDNCRNAAVLFKHLLLTKQDAFRHSVTTNNDKEKPTELIPVYEETNKNSISMQAPTIICGKKRKRSLIKL